MKLTINIDIEVLRQKHASAVNDVRQQIEFSDDLAEHAPLIVNAVHGLFEYLVDKVIKISQGVETEVETPA